MRLPKLFLKDKNLEEKVKEYSLEVKEGEIPGSFNEETMTDRVCKYAATYQLFFFQNYRKKIKDQVQSLNYKNPKILAEMNDKMNQLEKELEKNGIEWDWISKYCYNDQTYKDAKKGITYFWIRAGMTYYSKVVNYLPTKAANFFIKKSDNNNIPPTRWELLGAASYITLLTGEAILFNMALGFWWLFVCSALITGVVHGLSEIDREYKTMKEDKEFIKDYKKMMEKKVMVESFKDEKQQIVEFIKEHVNINVI